MTKPRYFLSIAVFIVLFFILGSNSVLAQGLVPCGTRTTAPCTACDLFVLLQKILNFLTETAAALVTLAVVYIGFLFLFSGGSSKKITEAKDKLWLVLWGIFWIFGSWLVMNTIINFVADPKVMPWRVWNQVDCKVSQQPAIAPTAPVSPGETVVPKPPSLPSSKLSEQAVRDALRQAGITFNHDNPCPVGVTKGCTTLEGLRSSTVEGAKQFKQECNCAVKVTGGTEQGHAVVGTKTHENGYKLDFARNNVLDAYVEKNYTYAGIRSSDKAKLYKSPSGVVFAKESNHWDTTGWDVEF